MFSHCKTIPKYKVVNVYFGVRVSTEALAQHSTDLGCSYEDCLAMAWLFVSLKALAKPTVYKAGWTAALT